MAIEEAWRIAAKGDNRKATVEEEGITLTLKLEHTAIAKEDIATRITEEGIGIEEVDQG